MQMRERDEGPQRWFQRRDGAIFPMRDEYHCTRLLQEGWVEVEQPAAKAKPDAAPVAPVVDPRDAEIEALKAELERLKAAKEPEHAIPTNDAAPGGGSPRPDRRSR